MQTESLLVPAGIAAQPYFANVNRAIETLERLGSPVAIEDAQQLAALPRSGNDLGAIEAAEKILTRYTLAQVTIEEDGYGRAAPGDAQRTLMEHGWRLFLVRVSNPIGSIDKLNIGLGVGWENLAPEQMARRTSTLGASSARVHDTLNMAPHIAEAWLTAEPYVTAPMVSELSGFPIEYWVIQLYSRDRGRHNATINFFTANNPHASYEAKFNRKGVSLDFDCLPSREVTLHVRDADDQGCVASLTIKDTLGRVYPLQAMRLAPDMFFHPQIYRADGETVRLPDGEYTVESKRGPEYFRDNQTVTIGEDQAQIRVRLKRWIDPAEWGWYSSDTHIHAAGCAHYDCPTEGVSPETIIRHVRGEGLSIGSVLTWGPAWYYQKQFFTGHAESPPAELEHPELQVANNAVFQPHPTPKDSESLLRYDVEVSGFPSSASGHLVLLRLKEQDYPGTTIIQDWPSWNLPILKWVRAQGGLGGYAHCGIGMMVDSTELPNYDIPPMDGIGTEEAIVDVAHGLVDFLSGCDTSPAAELNAWYHMLNCGFRLAMVGETDYPCLSDERPGVGRSYVRLEQRPIGDTGYEAWIHNLKKGKLYCGDGRSHFLEFAVHGHASGGEDVVIKASETVEVEATIAALLDLESQPAKGKETLRGLHGWHLELARIGKGREVPVELVVNGIAVDKVAVLADGVPRPVKFKTTISRSSWVALRILPSSHTHPVFIQVGGNPIRASKRSAQWCRACVDKLWTVKSPFMRESDRAAAADAYDHARRTYDTIIDECGVD